MIVKQLSNFDLEERFHKLVRTERKITHLVLECIAEIDHRKIYLQKAYSSLYDYLIKEFGYSPSAALRRIESARLLREVPEMADKIETGALNLSQISKLQQAIRTVQKTEHRKIGLPEKRELLLKIENTTQESTELILAQELNLPTEVIDKTKIHRDESVTLTMTLSKEQMELLKTVGDLISHVVPEKKWVEVVCYLAKKELNRRTKKKSEARKIEVIQNTGDETKAITSSTLRKPIPSALRKTILHQTARCEFRDPKTGKLCGSQRFLQIDHIHPIWAGGSNDPKNMRALCADHNQFKYLQEARVHP
jgi:5-methylcytosine-specific restriction endonuclease McrA